MKIIDMHRPHLIVIIGVLVGASVWGILGALLAAPLIATGREIFRYLYYRTIGENPFPPEKDLQADQQTVSFRESFDELKEKAQTLMVRDDKDQESQPEPGEDDPEPDEN